MLAAELLAAEATKQTQGSAARHSPACCSLHLAGRARDMEMLTAAEHLEVGLGKVSRA